MVGKSCAPNCEAYVFNIYEYSCPSRSDRVCGEIRVMVQGQTIHAAASVDCGFIEHSIAMNWQPTD